MSMLGPGFVGAGAAAAVAAVAVTALDGLKNEGLEKCTTGKFEFDP